MDRGALRKTAFEAWRVMLKYSYTDIPMTQSTTCTENAIDGHSAPKVRRVGIVADIHVIRLRTSAVHSAIPATGVILK